MTSCEWTCCNVNTVGMFRRGALGGNKQWQDNDVVAEVSLLTLMLTLSLCPSFLTRMPLHKSSSEDGSGGECLILILPCFLFILVPILSMFFVQYIFFIP